MFVFNDLFKKSSKNEVLYMRLAEKIITVLDNMRSTSHVAREGLGVMSRLGKKIFLDCSGLVLPV